MYSKQYTFNKVVKHLRNQGVRALDSCGDCQYRGKNGTMCAAGCLIPDEQYSPKMEGVNVSPKNDCCIEMVEFMKLLGHDVDLVYDLQDCHDDHDPEEWEFMFECIAQKYSLKVPEEAEV